MNHISKGAVRTARKYMEEDFMEGAPSFLEHHCYE